MKILSKIILMNFCKDYVTIFHTNTNFVDQIMNRNLI